MKIKIGINGLGRIGRMVLRAIIENENTNLEIKHINWGLVPGIYSEILLISQNLSRVS